MKKLDLVLESIRDEYMINVLEEGTVTELEALKTKKFLNENISKVRSMLITEGILPAVQDHLKNNWKKYLVGGATGAMMFNPDAQEAIRDEFSRAGEVVDSMGNTIGANIGAYGQAVANMGERAAADVADGAGQLAGYAKDAAGNLVQKAQNAVGLGDEAKA